MYILKTDFPMFSYKWGLKACLEAQGSMITPITLTVRTGPPL